MNDNLPDEKEYKKYNYKLTPFKLCVLQNFPFIEADFDAITNYQLLCKVVEYLNHVIDNQNTVEDNFKIMADNLNTLYNYIDTLDLQDEVNNWLDNATESGELENILYDYTNVTRVFDTVSDMKNDLGLLEGQKVKTLGYYEVNDGGGSNYIVTSLQNENAWQEELENGKYCDLIIENNIINFKQIGGRPQKIDNTKYDNKSILENYIAIISSKNLKPKLYIPSGIWYFSETLLQSEFGFEIFGDKSYFQGDGTIITALNNNQNTVWTIGNSNSYRTKDVILKNITISTAIYAYNSSDKKFEQSETLPVLNSALRLLQVTFSEIELCFWYINGTALSITSCYEIYFNKLFYRNITGFLKPVMNFEENITGSNCTALQFEEIMFEYTEGSLIQFDSHSAVSNSIFNNLNFEDSGNNLNQVTNDSYNDISATHWAIFYVKDSTSNAFSIFDSNIINNINLNNFAYYYHENNNIQYCYDTIFYAGSNNRISAVVNNVTSIGFLKKICMLKNNKETPCNFNTKLTFNNFIGYGNLAVPVFFDIYRFPRLLLGNIPFNQFIANQTTNDSIYTNNFIYPLSKTTIINSYTKGNLCYDDDSIVENKLSVLLSNSQYNNSIEAYFFKAKNEISLSVHAKIPLGETYILKTSGRNTDDNNWVANTLSMEGTGNYKWYTFANNFSNYNNDKRITFDGSQNASGLYCLIDAIKME